MSTSSDTRAEDSQPQGRKGRRHFYTNIKNLGRARIILKNLVYVIGLSKNVAKESLLRSNLYFGQYGTIKKLVVNKQKAYNPNGENGPSYSAYITFEEESASALCVLCLDGTVIDNHLLKASFGTTKFCNSFTRRASCSNKDCLYLHYYPEPEYVLDKDKINNPVMFKEQQEMAVGLAGLEDEKVRNTLSEIPKGEFRSPAEFLEEWTGIAKLAYEKLFSPKRESRFNFDFTEEGLEPVDVPAEVQSLISQNISRYSTFSNEQHDGCSSRSTAEVDDWLKYSPKRADADDSATSSFILTPNYSSE